MIVGMFVMPTAISSCSEDDPSDPTPSPSVSDTLDILDDDPVVAGDYTQQFRPQIHFSPAKNWINDPNGMVWYDGVWHLFYQYNPYGNDWGNMSWGHATSPDLVHWTEQAVALTKSMIGDIFSGSCVIDKDNTTGFGKDAMIAVYTGNGSRQQQGLAYSVDGGSPLHNMPRTPFSPTRHLMISATPRCFGTTRASSG